jgi:hypothetical protein
MKQEESEKKHQRSNTREERKKKHQHADEYKGADGSRKKIRASAGKSRDQEENES